MKAANALDYRLLAKRRLPHFLFEYVDGGSYDEVTLRRNRDDLLAVSLRQRVLRDVSDIDLSTELFGQRWAMPLALAPVGLGGMLARRGETQAVRAAEAAGVPFILSTVSACSVEEVARSATAPFWFQLYMAKDREFVRELLARAWDAGCPALFFTVDLPLPGARYRDVRSGLSGPPGWRRMARRYAQAFARPGWAWDVGVHGRPHQLGNLVSMLGEDSDIEDFFAWSRANSDASITWRDMEFIRSAWKGPLLIKGILDPEDAREATRIGAQGIVVSNHGGRQLDGVLSSARALPAIADAVGNDLTILADGGVRSGLDVVRMLALGANGVLIGRAWAYALAGGGGRGVAHVLQLLQAEMRVAMALTGVRRVSEINGSILA